MGIFSIEVVFDFVWRSMLILGLNIFRVNRQMGVKRLFSGVKLLHLLKVKRLGGRSNDRLPIPTELPCLSDLENPSHLPVREV